MNVIIDFSTLSRMGVVYFPFQDYDFGFFHPISIGRYQSEITNESEHERVGAEKET